MPCASDRSQSTSWWVAWWWHSLVVPTGRMQILRQCARSGEFHSKKYLNLSPNWGYLGGGPKPQILNNSKLVFMCFCQMLVTWDWQLHVLSSIVLSCSIYFLLWILHTAMYCIHLFFFYKLPARTFHVFVDLDQYFGDSLEYVQWCKGRSESQAHSFSCLGLVRRRIRAP